MTEATDDATLLNGARRFAGEGHFDDFGKVLVSVGVGHDVLPTGIARGVGGVDAVFVGGVGEGGHDAVGGEENGAVEGGELFALLPPSVAVVADKVLVFLERRIVVCGANISP